ncbi:hypothetical protein [Clostridium sp. DJ247]|uniref:hypothetical protein n=1 Tax=Clostridium sp. DJ247 TaxID=2726188 RepID=UPI001628B753|nr:hypothetical protein [Clostridium sp. DJ247]MBC2579824.1 hypothetical protein [Clostridium sp. DJ247]
MVKPSIFSKNYEKKMKRRKQNIIVIIILTIGIVISMAVYMKGPFGNTVNIKKIFKHTNQEAGNAKNDVVVSKDQKKSSNNTDSSLAEKNKEEKLEEYPIQLSNGDNIKAVYDTKNNDKIFKYISPAESNVDYSISPSGKKIVIFDDKVQKIILLDISGKSEDITNPKYVATDGSVITKSQHLSNQPSYIWCLSPRFIDEDNIAYISQLPWIGKTSKYVWIENTSSKTHTFIQEIQGEDLKLDKLTDKGITVIEDGKTVFLKSDGSVSDS